MERLLARAARQKQSKDRSSDRSIGSAREAVGKLWLSMTLVQSRLVLLQLAALLVAFGGIFKWYDKYFAAFFQRHAVLSVVTMAAVPLYILCFSVGPQMWHRWRKTQREAIKSRRHCKALSAGSVRYRHAAGISSGGRRSQRCFEMDPRNLATGAVSVGSLRSGKKFRIGGLCIADASRIRLADRAGACFRRPASPT